MFEEVKINLELDSIQTVALMQVISCRLNLLIAQLSSPERDEELSALYAIARQAGPKIAQAKQKNQEQTRTLFHQYYSENC